MAPLQSNLTSDIRRPLTAITFNNSTSRGISPVNRRLLMIGMKTAAGDAAVNVPIQVSDEAEARLRGGTGSEIAFLVDWAIRTSREVRRQRGGGQPQLWIIPIADPAGTAAVHRFALGGTAAEGKDLVVRIAGRTIRAAIRLGDAAAAAAPKLQEAIASAEQNLPTTSAVALSVNVDNTARQTGVNGNDIPIEFVDGPEGLTVTPSTTVVGVGAADITTALANSLSRDYQAVAIANHAAADVTALATHLTAARDATEKRLRQTFIGETGTLGTATTLAAPANSSAQCFFSIEGCPNTPGEVAVALASMSLTVERPSYNYSRVVLPLFAPSDADAYTSTETETAIAGGVTAAKVNDQGQVVMQRWVTSKITENGATFDKLLDGGNQKTLDHYALQIDAAISQAMEGASVDAEFLALATDIIFEILKAGERAGDLHNVDAHADEIRAEAHQSITNRVLYSVPQSVVQPNIQGDFTHFFFVEAPGAE